MMAGCGSGTREAFSRAKALRTVLPFPAQVPGSGYGDASEGIAELEIGARVESGW